jgi:UDP-N-acetylmuramoylalanine--D-glutamate ligase
LPELAAAIAQTDLSALQRWQFGEHNGAPAAWTGHAGEPALRWPSCRLRMPGRHNRLNAAAALTIAHALGIDGEAAVAALAGFDGLPHRLQFVAEREGVQYFNDSKGTTPEALETALAAFEQPLLLILGGYDKGADLRPVMRKAAARARVAACIGATGPVIAETIRTAGGRAESCDDLRAALEVCRREARAGDVVLLSPACASWGMYPDYRARGAEFVRLVRDACSSSAEGAAT